MAALHCVSIETCRVQANSIEFRSCASPNSSKHRGLPQLLSDRALRCILVPHAYARKPQCDRVALRCQISASEVSTSEVMCTKNAADALKTEPCEPAAGNYIDYSDWQSLWQENACVRLQKPILHPFAVRPFTLLILKPATSVGFSEPNSCHR